MLPNYKCTATLLLIKSQQKGSTPLITNITAEQVRNTSVKETGKKKKQKLQMAGLQMSCCIKRYVIKKVPYLKKIVDA